MIAFAAVQINCEPMPEGPEDMYNIGFVSTETVFNTELEAQRVANTVTSRYWKISNHESRNTLTGTPATSRPVILMSVHLLLSG